jgi:hypothetical protein
MRPLLVVNPRADRVFVELANRLIDDGAMTTDALEQSLRSRYPNAVVRERVLSDEQTVTWYVYREGRWIESASG